MPPNYRLENVAHNIGLMSDRKFGESKKWKKMIKKLKNGEYLSEEEYEYYKQQGIEYSNALKNKRDFHLQQIDKMEEKGIGETKRWNEIRENLNDGGNLSGLDLEYYSSKKNEEVYGIVTTTHDIQGKDIVAYHGIVSGQTVIGLMFLKDAIMKLTDTFGGRSGILERNFKTAKNSVLEQMIEESRKLGGNALVGVEISFNPIEGKNKQMLMVVGTATAVTARGKKQ